MLQFVLGGAKTGKSTKIKQLIREECKNAVGEKPVAILIVPEQFTYETEKRFFKEFSPELFKYVKITSFSRLATEIFNGFGGGALEQATNSAKAALMDIAIISLQSKLTVYKKNSQYKSFSKLMLDTISELKNAGVSPTDFRSVLAKTDGILHEKSNEISQIYDVYDALLSASYRDALDDISLCTKIIEGRNYFENISVYFDEFKGYTANENAFFQSIFSSAKAVTVALCVDLAQANQSEHSAFFCVKKTYEKITKLAQKSNCKILPNINLTTVYGYNSAELFHLNQNLFAVKSERFTGENTAITGVVCKNEYSEIDVTLAKIKELVFKKGYHYNDVAIISRDLDTYQSKLLVAFGKFGIPFFSDYSQKITQKPLVKLIQNALVVASKGFISDNILAVLKCGITKFTFDRVAELENYSFVWNVKSSAWKSEFTQNPRGYSQEFLDDDNEVLCRINEVRSYIVDALLGFVSELPKAPCEAINNLLNRLDVKNETQKLIDKLLSEQNFGLAQEYKNIWEIVTKILSTLDIALKNEPLTTTRFAQIFDLVCEQETLESLPQSLDCVSVGSAERVRFSDKKAVFILGVNDGIFPHIPKSAGAFTDKEREKLIEFEISVSPPQLEKILDEQFIAYKTLTSPTDMLFMTARSSDIAGKPMMISNIFSRIKKTFGDKAIINCESDNVFNGIFSCKSKDMAFSHLAKNYYNDIELTATLKEIFAKDEMYSKKMALIEKINQDIPFRINSKKSSSELFNDKNGKMNISPTRIETFNQCKFRYFCQHGLRVYPLKRAELDPLETGTLIHSILYSIATKNDLKNDFDTLKIKKQIRVELDTYINEVMGGITDKTKRFLYIYNRIRLQIFKLVEHIHLELLQSGFEPCDFEYEIGDGSDVTPLKLNASDGTEVIIAGKIDRIDSYISKNNVKYIRIIDYKSGEKAFKLNDILYGLNLQMLIYLFCIINNGKGKYENCLAGGILYQKAGVIPPKLPRQAEDKIIGLETDKFYRMNGLLVDNTEVLNAMEEGLKGVFIPISTKADGAISSTSLNNLVSLTELGKINKYINKLIIDMADELHNGNIQAMPLDKSCEYCNYSSVCGKNSDEYEPIIAVKRDEIMEQFDNGFAERGRKDE